MDTILNFNTIKEYNAFNDQETLHPLISVVNLDKAAPRKF
jgi:PHD/YefM family antitoxin component YafN of YafNO toxin-antitoxin module